MVSFFNPLEGETIDADADFGTIEQGLERAFPVSDELDRDVNERILAKIEAKRSRRFSSRHRLRSSIRPGRLLLAAGATVAMLVAFLSFEEISASIFQQVMPGHLSAAFIAKKALAAVEQPGKVVHYNISVGFEDVDSKTKKQSIMKADIWVDYQNKQLKMVVRSGPERGMADGGARFLIKGGRSTIVGVDDEGAPFVDERAYHGVHAAPFDQQVPIEGISGGVNKYFDLLKDGKAQLIGEETVRGMATYKLKVALNEIKDVDNLPTYEVVNVQKGNYLPVRIRTEYWEKDKNGRVKRLPSTITEFERVELLSQNMLGDNFFCLAIPKDAKRAVHDSYSLSKLKEFTAFDLYCLGDSFEGFKTDGMEYRKGENVGLRKVCDSEAELNYTDSMCTKGVRLIVRPHVEPSSLADRFPGQKSRLSIAGKPAVLVFQNHAEGYYELFLDMDTVTVQIGASDKDLAIRAAKALRKAN